jgi:hypothetical protein
LPNLTPSDRLALNRITEFYKNIIRRSDVSENHDQDGSLISIARFGWVL